MAVDSPDYTQITAHTDAVLVSSFNVAAGAVLDRGCTQYGSLIVVMNGAGGTVNCLLQIDVHQADTVGGTGDTSAATFYLSNPNGAVDAATWEIPLRGQSVRITNRSATAVNLVVYGSTRTVERLRLLPEQATPRRFVYTGATTANQATPLFTAQDGGSDCSFFTGPIQVGWSASLAFTGVLMLQCLTQDGSLQNIVVGANLAAPQTLQIAHPAVPVRWLFFANTTAAAITIVLNVMQL